MKLELMDKNNITLDQLIAMKNELYYIGMNLDFTKAYMRPLSEVINRAENPLASGEYLILRITSGTAEELIPIVPEEPDDKEEIEPPVDIVRDRPLRTWERQTYKINATKKDGSILIEGRPKGEIRVSFNDKEDADAWFERIREIFYMRNSNADAISIDNLYREFGFTEEDLPEDYSKEEGDKWGYLTIENGPIKYVSEVSKTKNSKLWGFTIKRPIKIYGMTDTGWWAKHKALREEGALA